MKAKCQRKQSKQCDAYYSSAPPRVETNICASNTLRAAGNYSDGEYKDDAIRADLLEQLKADIQAFSEELVEGLDEEELSFAAPIARKVR